ncbi:MAG: hypothetical protein WCJ75_08485 [Desulfomonile sp.]
MGDRIMARRKSDGNLPLFKKDIPQMLEGYYSGDKPNPNLRAFVEQHIKERPDGRYAGRVWIRHCKRAGSTQTTCPRMS